MELLKKWLENIKARTVEQRVESIKDEFEVREKDGKMWILHQGVAFLELDGNCKASSIPESLNKARETAIKYERLWK